MSSGNLKGSMGRIAMNCFVFLWFTCSGIFVPFDHLFYKRDYYKTSYPHVLNQFFEFCVTVSNPGSFRSLTLSWNCPCSPLSTDLGLLVPKATAVGRFQTFSPSYIIQSKTKNQTNISFQQFTWLTDCGADLRLRHRRLLDVAADANLTAAVSRGMFRGSRLAVLTVVFFISSLNVF